MSLGLPRLVTFYALISLPSTSVVWAQEPPVPPPPLNRPENPAPASPSDRRSPNQEQPGRLPAAEPLQDPNNSQQSQRRNPVSPLLQSEDNESTPPRRFNPFAAAAGSSLRASAANRRVASAPAMFGDFFSPGIEIDFGDGVATVQGSAPGGRIVKVSENNLAAIGDRCYITYNHFHNAGQTSVDLFSDVEVVNSNVDRLMIGIERRLWDLPWSLEVRMPFAGVPGESIQASRVGNLTFVLKRMLYENEQAIVSAGCGIVTPTGSDVTTGPPVSDAFIIRNKSYHILPFLGAQSQTASGRWYYHGFMQLDIAANGNEINTFSGSDLVDEAYINDQTLLLLDSAIGRWMYRNPEARCLRGLAFQTELHYTTTLQDGDTYTTTAFPTSTFGATPNRFDVLNFTTAVNLQFWDRTHLRVGGVMPIRDGDDRFFDAEFMVQLIFR